MEHVEPAQDVGAGGCLLLSFAAGRHSSFESSRSLPDPPHQDLASKPAPSGLPWLPAALWSCGGGAFYIPAGEGPRLGPGAGRGQPSRPALPSHTCSRAPCLCLATPPHPWLPVGEEAPLLQAGWVALGAAVPLPCASTRPSACRRQQPMTTLAPPPWPLPLQGCWRRLPWHRRGSSGGCRTQLLPPVFSLRSRRSCPTTQRFTFQTTWPPRALPGAACRAGQAPRCCTQAT